MTTSLAQAGGGVALMVLPSLVVGHELLILAGVAVVSGAWFLAHRHGRLRGWVDANPVADRPAADGENARPG